MLNKNKRAHANLAMLEFMVKKLGVLDEWLPYFASKATGDVLMEIAKDNASIEFLALCGHTHSEAHYQALNNLTVRAGKAEYGYPKIQEFFLDI